MAPSPLFRRRPDETIPDKACGVCGANLAGMHRHTPCLHRIHAPKHNNFLKLHQNRDYLTFNAEQKIASDFFWLWQLI